MTGKWCQIAGNGSYFELAGVFELSEFELPGFYCNSSVPSLLGRFFKLLTSSPW